MRAIKAVLIYTIICLMILMLSSCGKGPKANDSEVGRTIIDVLGREVEIPQKVDTIVCLGSGAPRIAAYLGVMDMLVGVEEHDKEGVTLLRDYSAIYYDTLKELPVIGAGGGSGANNGYPEQIISVQPDVIIAGYTAEAADELQMQTGIPVVSVRYLSINFIDESFYNAMNVFAETVNVKDRCSEVIEYIDSCKADLDFRTENIPNSEKPSVYAGAVTFSGRHGFAGTYANFGPLMGINAINVADEVENVNYFETDLEQIIKWDPDIIFLDPGNMDLVNDEYKTNPGYFNSIRAIQEYKVFTMPSYNNCSTNVTYALIDAYFAGSVLYPEAFSDLDFEEKAGEILEFFLGENIFDKMKSAGLYFGKIEIGA